MRRRAGDREQAESDTDQGPKWGVLAAIFRSGDRTRELAQVDVPTLVIHGDRDRMVHPTGGAATARAIRGARFETISGMGHDLPAGAWERITALIADHTATTDHITTEEHK